MWGEIDVANELQIMNNSRSQYLKMRNYELKSKLVWILAFGFAILICENDFTTNDAICRDWCIKFIVSHTRISIRSRSGGQRAANKANT